MQQANLQAQTCTMQCTLRQTKGPVQMGLSGTCHFKSRSCPASYWTPCLAQVVGLPGNGSYQEEWASTQLSISLP